MISILEDRQPRSSAAAMQQEVLVGPTTETVRSISELSRPAVSPDYYNAKIPRSPTATAPARAGESGSGAGRSGIMNVLSSVEQPIVEQAMSQTFRE